ncbi:unnamed protein product [Victoria cruziana]
MSTCRSLCALLFLALLLLQAFADVSQQHASRKQLGHRNEEGALYKKIHRQKINCKFACARRCREASRMNVCTRACGTCCMRCNCVPPGTYGHKDVCPCYASLKTHGNQPKCP